MAGVEQELLEGIIGEQLSSVEFVQDYLQLRFDGPTLTAYTTPQIIFKDRILSWGDPGYCDQLRSTIRHIVVGVRVEVDQAIEVTFDGEVLIRISLEASDYRGAEAAMFETREGHTWVL